MLVSLNLKQGGGTLHQTGAALYLSVEIQIQACKYGIVISYLDTGSTPVTSTFLT